MLARILDVKMEDDVRRTPNQSVEYRYNSNHRAPEHRPDCFGIRWSDRLRRQVSMSFTAWATSTDIMMLFRYLWMEELISFFSPLSILVIAVFILVASASRHQLKRRNFSLPPGPPGLPVIGNASVLFTKFPWIQFTQWYRTYGLLTALFVSPVLLNQGIGPIVHINVAGKSLLILNTAEIAFDLLDRRGSNYTDRPRLIMAGELLAGGIHIGFVPHGSL